MSQGFRGAHSRRDVLKIAGAGTAALGAASLPEIGLAQSKRYSIRIFANSTQRDPLQNAIDKFLKRYPGSEVRMNVANTDQLQTTTRVQLTSGTAPDIITVWPGNGNPLAVQQIAPAGYLADVSDQPFVKHVPESFKDITNWNGKPWYLAFQISVIGCMVNLQVWNKLGLKQPQTWTEFVNACQKVKDAGIIPIALGNGTPWVTQLINYALVPTTVFADNPRFAEDMLAGKATFAGSAGWREAMSKYMELNSRGFFNPNPNGTSYEETLQMVGSGRAAMCIQTAGGIISLLKFSGHRDFVVWPLPGSDDPAKTQVASSPTAGLGVNAKAQDKEGAIAFLNFLAEPENAAEYSRITVLPTFIQGEKADVDPIYAPILEYIAKGKSVLYMDNKWPNARVQQTHFSGVQELFSGKATIEAVLTRMDEAFKAG